MEVERFVAFLVVASITIASPGPGVILTISNTLKYGFNGAVAGILGIVVGMLIISTVAASGVGVVILASKDTFLILKYLGAAYLAFLGLKLWFSKSKERVGEASPEQQGISAFTKGLLVTLANPKALVFFVALFPQFIDTKQSILSQFIALSTTFSLLVLGIHLIYALMAGHAKQWFSTETGYQALNKLSGGCFFSFAVGLAFYR